MEDMLSQAVVAASAEVMPSQAEDIMVAGFTGVVIITAAATMGREDCISASAALFTGRTIITPRRRDITVAASIAILRTHNRVARQGRLIRPRLNSPCTKAKTLATGNNRATRIPDINNSRSISPQLMGSRGRTNLTHSSRVTSNRTSRVISPGTSSRRIQTSRKLASVTTFSVPRA